MVQNQVWLGQSSNYVCSNEGCTNIAVAVTVPAAFTSSSTSFSCRHRCVVKRNHDVVPRGASNFLPTAAATATTISDLDTKNNNNAIKSAKEQINQAISNTDKGRSASEQQRSQITSYLSHLESLCPLMEPARSPLMDGPWIVLYTDAPPPSNGQLGPLKGVAKQVIDLQKGTYKNELYVGGTGTDEDQNAWLSAVLEATWKEWDGVYLDNDGERENGGENENDGEASDTSSNANTASSSTPPAIIDHGATTWRVDFVSLTLSIFQLPIFTQNFQKGTARTWKMTYLDEDTRIVRAGKTGRGEDDWIFYMRRGGDATRLLIFE